MRARRRHSRAQALGVLRELPNQLGGFVVPDEKLTPNGGAVAIGHPFGATGARITTTLLNGLRETDGTFGLETMCVGGGQGMAIIYERLS